MSHIEEFRHLEIQLEGIKAATNNFSDINLIGNGGFGAVYKGELLLEEERKTVAFKRLDRKHGQGEVEFWKEVMVLSKLKHQNLVSLLHVCTENGERILVYEYASRGSLDMYLGLASLTWIQRLHICLGAARGIAYFHDPKKTPHGVVHGDIKSSNILLDDEWTAKVTDFGQSKIIPANQPRTYLVSNAVGTVGYCDPAYYETGILSKECDMYSFGVVLLEVMCGRLCIEFDKDKFISILVPAWKKCCDEDRLDDIVFPHLKQQTEQESLSMFAAIATRCLNEHPQKRPNMVEVIKELEAVLQNQKTFKQSEANVAKARPTYEDFLKKYDYLRIGLDDIKRATNKFADDQIIGRGGFGKVYKGELSLPEGQSMVCFKRLDRKLGQGDDEFMNEITILSKYQHENLVSLLKFCMEGDDMILVYKYASRLSLDNNLKCPDLTWAQRLKICLGIAHAISYLHNPHSTNQIVVHRDIKSANILLDEDWTATVSDFGLSKVSKHSYFVARLAGTPEYSDPAYMETSILSRESDVYSFGVVLFEVMCGTLCSEYRDRKLLVYRVPGWKKCFEEKRLDDIIFYGLKDKMDSCSLNTFSSVAYRCLERTYREERPTMAEVVKELKIALEQQEDFEQMMRTKNLMICPTPSKSPNQNFKQFPEGILDGDGHTWLSKLKNGKVCEVISAVKCIYADSLVHDDTQKSRFSNVIKGQMYNGFTIKATTQFLSTEADYTVSLIFKHNGADHGTHIPFKFKVGEERDYSNSCTIHLRDDGWLMIKLYQFRSLKSEHDLEIQFLPLFNITSSSIHYFIQGIEFRPVQYVS